MCEHQTLKFWLANEQQTRQAGAALAAALVPLAESAPIVIFVRGDLGAGKSTLVRGFLVRSGITGVMPSPTYSLVEPYQAGRLKIFHMDAYRLADAAELDYLGLDDIDSPESILLVEWPDHIRESLPTPTLTIDLNMAPRPDRHNPDPQTGQAQQSVNAAANPGQAQVAEQGQAQSSAKKANLGQAQVAEQGQAQVARTNEGQAPLSANPGQAQVARTNEGQARLSTSGDRTGQAQPSAPEKGSVEENGPLTRAPDEFTTTSGEFADGGAFLEMGRLLSVSLEGVPVHLRGRLEASEEWKGLLRVVT